jgi:hypothetical protein
MTELHRTKHLDLRASPKRDLASIDLSFKNSGLQIIHRSAMMLVYSVIRKVNPSQY